MKSAAKEACWRERLQNQAESGLSVRAFSRREGLSEPSFYSWRRELEKRDHQRAQPDGQSEAGVARNAVGTARLVAVDVVGVLGEATLEIAVAGGVLIRLREEASAETLDRVLAAACRQRGALIAGESLLDDEAESC